MLIATLPDAVRSVAEAVLDGQRITKDEALLLSYEADLHTLMRLAHAVRMNKATQRGEVESGTARVTYVVDRNINYSNICSCGCKFCAFFAAPGDARGYVLSLDELERKVEETVALGGSQILMQGGHHPDLPFSFYEDMLGHIRSRFPSIHIHAFSPPEIVYFSKLYGMAISDVVRRLREAGLASIPGGGAEILMDRVRSIIAPNKCSAGAWLGVMREAHMQGLKTTATMMFGHVESRAERIEHMLAVRELQDETGGFTAFIPWGFQPRNTALATDGAGAVRRSPTSCSYMRVLALSVIVLDNVPNIQASWVTMGPQIAQLALLGGANDFGSTMIEENVVAATGVSFSLPEDDIRRLIREAGFLPRRRRMDYSLRDDDAGDEQ